LARGAFVDTALSGDWIGLNTVLETFKADQPVSLLESGAISDSLVRLENTVPDVVSRITSWTVFSDFS
jgi:hypothetical protein